MQHTNVLSEYSVSDSVQTRLAWLAKQSALVSLFSSVLTDNICRRENLNHRSHCVSPIHLGRREHEHSNI